MVLETRKFSGEALLIPPGAPGGAKEDLTLVVVESVNLEATLSEEGTNLRPDEAGGSSDKE